MDRKEADHTSAWQSAKEAETCSFPVHERDRDRDRETETERERQRQRERVGRETDKSGEKDRQTDRKRQTYQKRGRQRARQTQRDNSFLTSSH